MKLDTIISGVITIRDQISELKKQHKDALAPWEEKLAKLEAYLQNQLQTQGMTSFAVKGVGTAYLSNSTSCTVEDWDATLAWIKSTEAWEFLERRVSKTVVQEYMESQGETPPGVNVRTEVEVRIRRG